MPRSEYSLFDLVRIILGMPVILIVVLGMKLYNLIVGDRLYAEIWTGAIIKWLEKGNEK